MSSDNCCGVWQAVVGSEGSANKSGPRRSRSSECSWKCLPQVSIFIINILFRVEEALACSPVLYCNPAFTIGLNSGVYLQCQTDKSDVIFFPPQIGPRIIGLVNIVHPYSRSLKLEDDSFEAFTNPTLTWSRKWREPILQLKRE